MTAKDHSIRSPLLDDNGQQSLELSDPTEQQQQQLPPDYISSTIQENEPSDDEEDNEQPASQIEDNSIYDEHGQVKFPLNDLIKLEEQLNQTRWVVPVLPDGELIKCLRAAVRLASQKVDTKSDSCQRFIRDSLVNSFTKVLCDEAVQTWKHEIFKYIYQNCMVFIELCVLKLEDDCLPLLEVLGLLMNPSCRFHQSNHSRISDLQLAPEKEIFAVSNEYRMQQRGWLIDFINRFGDLGGFDKISTRFLSSENKLTISVVVALLKPWGLCYEYLTHTTVKKYFAPIINFVPQFLDQLTENDLKIETKSEPKSDTLSTVIRWLRYLASRIPDNEKECRNLDMLRLKMILRILQTNSFSGKMNALNEVNKLIMSLNTIQRSTLNRSEEPESLTAEKLIQWIQENQVLDIVLRDCLHQPQYVEKLEKILRFIIKEQALSRTDLDKIWNSSCGKHEAIEKNVHDLLAKLAWDFSPEQLEHLFDCFRESWTKASKKQREKLLELIRRLAEDDKEGLMANKVLELLWNIAHDQNLPNEIIDQALTAHLKILDYSCLQEKEKTKLIWLDKFMDEVKHDRGHVMISLKQLREICMQFHEGVFAQNIARMPGPQNRTGVIDILEKKYELTRVVTENLCQYMETARKYKESEGKGNLVPEEYFADGRFNHNQQIHERLNFLKFTLKEGRLYLSAEHSKMIWISLAEQAIYPNDREQCFRWFAEIIDEDDFEPKAAKDFFQNHLMKLEPNLLTDLGMNCFDRFFKSVNAQLNKLQQKRRSIRLMNDEDLVGIEYLWKLILNGSDEVADRGIQLMREIYTNISPQLKTDVKRIHESFISDCFERLRPVYDSVKLMHTQQDSKQEYQPKLNSLIRILIVLREYLAECDNSYHKERSILPMARAFRGRAMTLIIRVNTGQNRTDDFEHGFHSNDTWGHIRRFIHNRYKSAYGIIELYRNNEIIYTTDDNRTLGQTDDRDRIAVTARWVQHQNHGGSSGESSSSESEINNNNNSLASTSHHNRSSDFIDINAESALPSVIFSQKHEYYQFLIDIADLACKEGNTRLRDTSRHILDLIPMDSHATKTLNSCFTLLSANNEQPTADECLARLNHFYFNVSPSQMLYNLKTTLINFLPAQIHQICLQNSSHVEGLHVRFLNAGGLACLLNILTEKHYTDECDVSTRKSIYFVVLYLLKRLLIILVIYQLRSSHGSTSSPFDESLEQILSIMPTIPLPVMNIVGEQQHISMSVEQKIATTLIAHRMDYPIPKNSLLQYHHIKEFIRLIWCLAADSKQNSLEMNLKNDFNVIHQTFKQENFRPNENSELNDDNEEDDESQLACREGLELLCISLALVPSSVENLLKEHFFEYFFIDLILYCQYQIIRHTSSEQIFLLTSRCSQGQCENLIQFILQKQFQFLNKSSENLKHYSSQSSDFFLLLCRLLSYAYSRGISPPNIHQQLDDEIQYLKHISLPVDDHLLRGHINIAKELLQFQTSERKRYYGIDQTLIQQIVEQYLFPASTLLYNFRLLRRKRLSKQSIVATETTHNEEDNELDLLKEPPVAICQTPMSTLAAFDLLVVLGTNCIENLKLIDKYITDLFYTVPDSSLNEWDFAPLVGPRPNRSFVGLKNGGATCYMNSVFQQLFMIRPLRTALLSVKIPVGHGDDETDDDDQRRDNFDSFSDTKFFLKDSQSMTSPTKQPEIMNTTETSPKNTTNERNEYNIQIFRHIQWIFGHLLESKLQFYIPRGFWKIFKFSGEPVNLRDQHDAVEFLNTVVDSIDEALKSLNLPQICSQVLGGTFADQKICKDCPHRYSREEDFTLISVDIRHSQNLKESLEQYVIGELLDGPNAYFCEKCNKKVDTIKRTCFKKLPPILAIQLKRFDYDWERETPIKFNDYFEFPRELDMEPYTVQGLAKAEGMSVIDESADDDLKSSNGDTRYKLVGIIVHSGQANGGHYYSFVQNKEESNPSDSLHWYKFDDTDVSECKMDDDEELRSQCFGGDYPAQSFDQPVMKRQRRWWNAYILFYEQMTTEQTESENSLEKNLSQLQLYDQTQRMPLSVQRSVRKQNIKFLHNRIHFSPEYFHFMKRLVQSNVQVIVTFFQQQQQQSHGDKLTLTNTIETIEDLALVSVQIATKFLFSIGWRTKKALRGPANEWTELIIHCLRWSRKARYYLAEEVLFKHPSRFQEYLIDCTSAEIRNAFGKMLVALASHSRQDEQTTDISTDDIKTYLTVEESILNHVLRLLKKEMPDNVKMLTQYFQFFVNYSSIGRHECEQLIRLNVPTLFVTLANDDSSSSSCSTLPRYGEPAKLFVILSTLIRCFDVSSHCRSRQSDAALLPNPYYTHDNDPICPMPHQMADIIYKRDIFLKKIIENSGSCEESLRLLRFLIWENPEVTSVVLNEIITLLSMYHTYDFRAHLDVLYTILITEDSWQEVRLLYALKGVPMSNTPNTSGTSPTTSCGYESTPQNLFDMFVKSKSTQQKKAYNCIKTLVQLFSNCQKANHILKTDADMKQRWSQAVRWLHEQLDRSYNNIQTNYPYYASQGPVTSNDMSQGCFIERTQSARSLLDKAVELYPEMVENDDAGSNSDDLEDDEPMENVSPNVVIKNVGGNVSSKMTPTSSRRPNSPSVVNSSLNQRISPSPVQQNKSMQQQHHHPRS